MSRFSAKDLKPLVKRYSEFRYETDGHTQKLTFYKDRERHEIEVKNDFKSSQRGNFYGHCESLKIICMIPGNADLRFYFEDYASQHDKTHKRFVDSLVMTVMTKTKDGSPNASAKVLIDFQYGLLGESDRQVKSY